MAEKTKAEERRLNLTGETVLEQTKLLKMTLRGVAEATGRHRAAVKMAKSLGINTTMLLAAIRQMDRDSVERNAEQEEYARYMAWLGMPMNSQSSMPLDDQIPAKVRADFALSVHEDNGYQAGLAGRARDDHGLEPGTPAHAAWDKGHQAGSDFMGATAEGTSKPKASRKRAADALGLN